jgi:peroxiredoxin
LVKQVTVFVATLNAIGAFIIGSAFSEDKELPAIEPGAKLEVAKDFQLADLNGVRTKLSDVKAPVVVLHFWSKYRDCKYDLELLQKLHKKYGDRNVKIIGVVFSSGTRDEVNKFVSDLGVEFPNLMCTNDVRSAYDVSTFPTTFLLDSDKKIRYWMYGIMVEKHWDQLVAELLEDSKE